VLVVVEQRHAVAVLDRDDGLGEVAGAPRGGRSLLRLHGVGVHVLAAEALDGCDEVCADALRDEVGVVRGLGVHRPGTAVGAHRDPAHALDTAGDDQLVPAGADLLSGHVHGLQCGGAEAVDLGTGHGVGQAGEDRGGLGDVGALVPDRSDTAQHQVVDGVRVHPRVPRPQFVDQSGHQGDGLDSMQ
jgi:hypothetical protein